MMIYRVDIYIDIYVQDQQTHREWSGAEGRVAVACKRNNKKPLYCPLCLIFHI